jgi:hypothetical protein
MAHDLNSQIIGLQAADWVPPTVLQEPKHLHSPRSSGNLLSSGFQRLQGFTGMRANGGRAAPGMTPDRPSSPAIPTYSSLTQASAPNLGAAAAGQPGMQWWQGDAGAAAGGGWPQEPSPAPSAAMMVQRSANSVIVGASGKVYHRCASCFTQSPASGTPSVSSHNFRVLGGWPMGALPMPSAAMMVQCSANSVIVGASGKVYHRCALQAASLHSHQRLGLLVLPAQTLGSLGAGQWGHCVGNDGSAQRQ